MRSANGGDVAGMARCREPVVDRPADRPTAQRRLAGTLMTGDQENHALAQLRRDVERAVDRTPSAVEAHSVKIDDAIGLDASAAEAPIPAAVEGPLEILPGPGRWQSGGLTEGARVRIPMRGPLHQLRWFPSPFRGGFQVGGVTR